MTNRTLAYVAIAVGIVFIALALLYWIEPAKSLPSFLPGHQAGSMHHHVKHGTASLVVALAAFAFAWFQTGPSASGRGKL